MSSNFTTFVIADGLNTSYIDSLLMGLFYRTTHLQEMLSKSPEKSKFAYLQDLMNNVIDQTRRNFSVDSSYINEIRNYSFICGWKDNLSLTELYNVVDYLDFIMKGFDFEGINCEVIELSKNSQDEMAKSLKLNYIEVNVNTSNKDNIDIKTLLEDWINSNLIEKNKNSLTYYHFKELPMLIPIYVNRLDENKQSVNTSVDIKKRIRFYKNNDKTQLSMEWIIHSIICFSSSGNGRYYTIINVDNDDWQWYLFSNDKLPSLVKINISDSDISNKIKQECVLVLYRLCDNLCKF
jgi:hypothetical protein